MSTFKRDSVGATCGRPRGHNESADYKWELMKPLPSLCRIGVIMTPSPYSENLQIFNVSGGEGFNNVKF